LSVLFTVSCLCCCCYCTVFWFLTRTRIFVAFDFSFGRDTRKTVRKPPLLTETRVFSDFSYLTDRSNNLQPAQLFNCYKLIVKCAEQLYFILGVFLKVTVANSGKITVERCEGGIPPSLQYGHTSNRAQ